MSAFPAKLIYTNTSHKSVHEDYIFNILQPEHLIFIGLYKVEIFISFKINLNFYFSLNKVKILKLKFLFFQSRRRAARVVHCMANTRPVPPLAVVTMATRPRLLPKRRPRNAKRRTAAVGSLRVSDTCLGELGPASLTHWALRDFKPILVNGGWGISYEIALRWMPLDFTDEKSTLVQVMAWCHQATGHYLSQCWPRSVSPNGVTRPQWVNSLGSGKFEWDFR